MSTEITHAMIENAKSAVNAYRSNVKSQFEALQNEINNLRATNFKGDASDGYLVFFNQKVTPALNENIDSMLRLLKIFLTVLKHNCLMALIRRWVRKIRIEHINCFN